MSNLRNQREGGGKVLLAPLVFQTFCCVRSRKITTYLPGGSGSAPGWDRVWAEVWLLVQLRKRKRRRRRCRVGPGQAGSVLQGEELRLPPQSTLLSVLLQSGWVTL